MKQATDPRAAGIFLQSNGITLHCIEAGPKDGPLVILLHGFPEFWWGWRYQIEPLAQAGFRVLVPDQRGYNLSDKPEGRRAYQLDLLAQDVIGLMDALGCSICSLVGHDWGGIAAWWTATRHPDRIDRLVAINAPHPDVAGSYMRRHPSQMLKSSYVGFFQLPFIPEAMLSADSYKALRRSLLRTSRKDTFSSADLAEYEKAWTRPGALTAMLNWYRALPFKPSQSVEAKLAMPVLAIWGMRDPFLEFGLCEKSLALCTKPQVSRFEKATHWVHLEDPDAVSRRLVDFLKA
ncbi:alpha/beta fold hydrolase [Microvirga guangxiensis]|uniref:Pimeloyl-ACP methyl ester carboxylesterase n=1 Tax=Microvirga guangxiensis TaxID=549386 RepID=A0A1G5EGZ6_9HYPH|nr:alpha/beta hydrolase [Microvirga guangxiensis]SCY26259.1 Pimeloyl-ACP methyl ester carboxylesterase [Microvirga guangxiensis]